MLTVYRRHSPKCKYQSMSEKRCHCPLWVNGPIDGKLIRQSLKNEGLGHRPEKSPRLGSSGDGLRHGEGSVGAICRRLRGAGPGRRAAWKIPADERGNGGAAVRAAVRPVSHGGRSGPLPRNLETRGGVVKEKIGAVADVFQVQPGAGLEPGESGESPEATERKAETGPAVQRRRMEKILWATEVYPDRPKRRREQVKAFVLVLRWTGLAIGDAISLETGMVRGNQIARRGDKTDVAVSLPIPDEVVSSLQRLPTAAGRFFWSGQGKLKSAVANWQRSLKKLFDLAGIGGGHPHRFRHTFSVDLLSKGVSLENVSKALGHSSVKITEKFYGAWVKSRQEALDSEIRKAWAL